jgi:hypothetical protein
VVEEFGAALGIPARQLGQVLRHGAQLGQIRGFADEEMPADLLAERLQALKASENACIEALQKEMDQLSGGVDAP